MFFTTRSLATAASIAALGSLFLLAAPSAFADAPSTSVRALIAAEERDNDRCRGGSGDDPATQRACDRRDDEAIALGHLGWCFGTPDEPEYKKSWQECVFATATWVDDRRLVRERAPRARPLRKPVRLRRRLDVARPARKQRLRLSRTRYQTGWLALRR